MVGKFAHWISENSFKRKELISILVMILGVSISIGLYYSLKKAQELKADQTYTRIYNSIHSAIQSEIDLNLDALYAIKSFYLANHGFRHHEFHEFSNYYTNKISSIQALEWVPEIHHSERDSFELAMRNEGFLNFEIFTTTGAQRKRADWREKYYPVAYIAPFNTNKAALGFDPGATNPTRVNTINKAIETGEAAVSDHITIIQKKEPHQAILAFVPVFESTGDSKVYGLVEGVYLVDQLINAGLKDLKLASSIDISLTWENNKEIIFHSASVQRTSKHQIAGPLALGQRNLVLTVYFTETLANSLVTVKLILALALCMTLGIAWFTYKTLESSDRTLARKDSDIRSIFNNTDSGIALFDANLKLKEWNHSFAHLASGLMGFVAKNGDPLDKFTKFNTEVLSTAIESGQKANISKSIQSEGVDKRFAISYLPIIHGTRFQGLSLFVEDVTDVYQYELELKNYSGKLEDLVEQRTEELARLNISLINNNKKLEASILELRMAQEELVQSRKMASLGTIAAGIAHELNNPLNFIIGGTHVLKNSDNRFEIDEKERALNLIVEGADRAAKIVKGLSNFSRRSTSFDEFCHVNQILDNCLVMVSENFSHKIKLRKKYQEDLPHVMGNEALLHQVFLNILTNAEQSIEGEGTIHIETKHTDSQVMVVIRDNGTGIDKSILDQITDPFFTTKDPGIGTGLGLSIAYNVLQEHNALLKFESTVGEGTECTVVFSR